MYNTDHTVHKRRKRGVLCKHNPCRLGLLMPLAEEELRRRGHIDVDIVASNMHLLDSYASTPSTKIRNAGFEPTMVDMAVDGDDEVSRAHAMALLPVGHGRRFRPPVS